MVSPSVAYEILLYLNSFYFGFVQKSHVLVGKYPANFHLQDVLCLRTGNRSTEGSEPGILNGNIAKGDGPTDWHGRRRVYKDIFWPGRKSFGPRQGGESLGFHSNNFNNRFNFRMENHVIRAAHSSFGHLCRLSLVPAETPSSPRDHPVRSHAESPINGNNRSDRLLPHHVPSQIVHLTYLAERRNQKRNNFCS